MIGPILKLVVQPLNPIFAVWDIRGIQRSRQSRRGAAPQVTDQRPTLAVAVCKTVVFTYSDSKTHPKGFVHNLGLRSAA